MQLLSNDDDQFHDNDDSASEARSGDVTPNASEELNATDQMRPEAAEAAFVAPRDKVPAGDEVPAVDAAHFLTKLANCAALGGGVCRDACATVAGIVELARDARAWPKAWEQACRAPEIKIRPTSESKIELAIAKYAFGKNRQQSSRYATAAKYIGKTEYEGSALIDAIEKAGGVEGCAGAFRKRHRSSTGTRRVTIAVKGIPDGTTGRVVIEIRAGKARFIGLLDANDDTAPVESAADPTTASAAGCREHNPAEAP
jgi:hypothetical protein